MKLTEPLDLQVPETYQDYLRIGTCSWKYDSWKGLIYEPDVNYEARDYLADYARTLNTVEIDQWFWSLFPAGLKLPELPTVKQYAESVPEGFVFTIKAPNVITLTHFPPHQPKQYASFAKQTNPNFLNPKLLARFLETLKPMADKIGPILFQFEYLNRSKVESSETFLSQLGAFFADAPEGYEYAVEIRNRNYLSAEFFECLRARGVGFIFIEGYFMPPVGEVHDTYDTRTAPFSVVRLHGPNRLEVEEQTGKVWNEIVEPRPEGLEATARIVRENARRKIRTFVNVNNHYEGSAPLTIARLLEILRQE